MRTVFVRWALGAVGAVVLVFALAMGYGTMIPSRIEVTRTIFINRPPENVWWVLTDYNNLSLWHPQYKGAQMTSLPGEKPTRWRAIYTDGRVCDVEVAEEDAPTRYAEKLADTNLPFAGGWT